MIPLPTPSLTALPSFPRVSGDDPAGFPSLLVGAMFSPRERG